MIALALAAAAAAQPAAAAERAFAAAARRNGQWTAFRAFMAPGAVRLAPGVRPAAEVLAGLVDPPTAIEWRPARTVTACDGSLAFSTGPWRKGPASGRFLSIWQRQPDGAWKWLFDAGTVDPETVHPPFEGGTREVRAGCTPPGPVAPASSEAGGASADGTLTWSLHPGPIAGAGHLLRVRYWAGGQWVTATETIVSG